MIELLLLLSALAFWVFMAIAVTALLSLGLGLLITAVMDAGLDAIDRLEARRRRRREVGCPHPQ